MGDIKFDGTPEEWDALVGKNKKNIQTDENQNEGIISDEEINKQANDWYNKEGMIRPSKVEIRAWVNGAKYYRDQLKLRQ